MSNHYAVIGDPIEHSLSPIIHQYFAKQCGMTLTYEKIQANAQDFEAIVTSFFAQGGKGLNVTMPHKEAAYQLAQVRTPRCREAGAANTLWKEAGQLHADNTDGVGLIRDLSRYISVEGKRLLLLGAGGAARSVIGELLKAGISDLTIANRTLEKVDALQSDFPAIQGCDIANIRGKFDVLIHASSAGLSGEPFNLPIDCPSYCYDLSYNLEAPTPFVEWARVQSSEARDGLGMLIEQAAESFWVWHGVRVYTEAPIF